MIAIGITFINSAGSSNEQAMALRSTSHLSAFYQCRFEGFQDTLFVGNGTQFYRSCEIYGSVDFIFGDAAAVFQNCDIYVRNPPPGKAFRTWQTVIEDNLKLFNFQCKIFDAAVAYRTSMQINLRGFCSSLQVCGPRFRIHYLKY